MSTISATAPVPARCRTHADTTVDFQPYPAVNPGRPGCPRWCTQHADLPEVGVHYSTPRTVVAAITGPHGRVTESHDIDLQAMATDDGSDAVIFVDDTPMTASTARVLAGVLFDLAGRVDGVR